MEYWNNLWDQGQTPWHSQEPNKYLVQFYDLLCPQQDQRLCFLLPLCGKAGDILWLFHQGHDVIGIEGSVKGVEEFFAENQLPSVKTEISATCSKYQSQDGRITVYCSDLYTFDPEWLKDGPRIDRVFDRGSLVAVNPEDRGQYARKLRGILQAHSSGEGSTKYLLSSYEYDQSEFPGPPRAVWRGEIDELFSDWAHIEILGEFDESPVGRQRFKLSRLHRLVFLLSPRRLA